MELDLTNNCFRLHMISRVALCADRLEEGRAVGRRQLSSAKLK
jgi:hypothetical protein